jgi:heme A synthase
MRRAHETRHHSATEGLHDTPIWALTGGLALYLIALSALRRRNLGKWNVQRLVLAVAVLAVTPLLELVPAVTLVVIVALAGVGLIVFERLKLLSDSGRSNNPNHSLA